MAEKYTVASIKLLVVAVAESAAVVEAVFKDGKVTLSDLSEAPALLSALRDFAAVPYAQLMPEVTDLSKEEAVDLSAHFATHFNIVNDSVEGTIETGFAILLNIAVAVKAIRDNLQKVVVTPHVTV